MALRQILSKRQQVTNARGEPLAAGQVYLYEPNTTTKIAVYSDSGLVTQVTNPVKLSGSGRAEIWVSRDCDVRIEDRNGNLIVEELNANPDSLGVDETGGLVPNGSFETDADADTVPDGWTLTNETGSTNAIDTSESTDGAQCFRFTGVGTGGGTLETTNFFPVNDIDDLRVAFDLRSTVATVRNIVRVRWFDVSEVFISNSDVYDSTSNPTSFTSNDLLASPPANARFAKLAIIGCDPSVAVAGSTYVDRVRVFYPAVVAGVFDNVTVQNNEIITTNTNGDLELKPNGTGQVIIQYNGNDVFRAGVNGGRVEIRSAGNTDAENRQLNFAHQDGTLRGRIGHFASTSLGVRNAIHGGLVVLDAEDSGGTTRVLFSGDPDGAAELYVAGVKALATAVTGASVFSQTSTDTENRYLGFHHQDGTLRGYVGFAGTDELILRNVIHGADVFLQSENLAGSVRSILQGDPDGDTRLFYQGTRAVATIGVGAAVYDTTGDNPGLNFFQDDLATRNAFIQAQVAAGLVIRQEVHGLPIILQAEDTGGTSRSLLIGDPDADVKLYYAGTEMLRSSLNTADDINMGAQVKHGDGSFYAVGLHSMPVVEQDASATVNNYDAIGKILHKDSGTPAYTLDQNTDVQVGAIWMIANEAGGNMTVVEGTGVTLRWFAPGSVSTGTRTLATGAIATVYKYTDTEYWIWGQGIS